MLLPIFRPVSLGRLVALVPNTLAAVQVVPLKQALQLHSGSHHLRSRHQHQPTTTTHTSSPSGDKGGLHFWPRSNSFTAGSNNACTTPRGRPSSIGVTRFMVSDAADMDLVDEGNDGAARSWVRPRIPVSSITGFGQGLGIDELQSLSKELEIEREGALLADPFASSLFDISNAALFYAHNGRLEAAQEKLNEGQALVSFELKRVDDGYPKEGIRHDKVSYALEQLIKARALVHFLQTGRLLPKASLEEEIEDNEYLAAAMGLTSELARYAITQASVLDRDSIQASARLCRDLFGELVQFDLRNGPLRKKFDSVKYDVRKIDDILYEISLVGENAAAATLGTTGSSGAAPAVSSREGAAQEAGGGDEAGRKRSREETNEASEGAGVRNGSAGEEERESLDKAEFEVLREVMVALDERREAVIKRTRDVQKWSKMAIYSLHRKDFAKAGKQVSDCRAACEELLPLIKETPSLRQGSYSNSMEEFAEARLYEVWLKERRLATRDEVGLVNTEEYLGGLFDLTGEINRFAVARATERDTAGVKECLETVLVIHEFVTLNRLPTKLLRKKKELNISLRKLQNMTYELALMKAGKGKVAGVSGLDDGPSPAANDDTEDNRE